MYYVYADEDKLIYSPDMADSGFAITSPTCAKEINKAGSFEFGIYNTNPYYNLLKPLKTIITVKDNGTEIWRGRVLNTEKVFDNKKTVYCEGTLSFLVDSVIRPHDHTKTMPQQFAYLIGEHNNQVEEFKKFEINIIDVDDPYGSIQWKADTYQNTKEKIDNLVNTYGGYLVTTHENGKNKISYVKDPSRFSSQEIDFSKNLLSLTETINTSNLFTALIPVAYDADGNKITIVSVNNNKDYIISQEGQEEYGLIFYSHTFSETIATPAALLEKATDFLNKNIKAARTLSIEAFDLHVLYPDIDRIDVYDKIKVTSSPHGVNEYEMCSKATISLENPESSEYIIGTIPDGIVADVATLQVNNYTIIQKTTGGTISNIPDGDNQQY